MMKYFSIIVFFCISILLLQTACSSKRYLRQQTNINKRLNHPIPPGYHSAHSPGYRERMNTPYFTHTLHAWRMGHIVSRIFSMKDGVNKLNHFSKEKYSHHNLDFYYAQGDKHKHYQNRFVSSTTINIEDFVYTNRYFYILLKQKSKPNISASTISPAPKHTMEKDSVYCILRLKYDNHYYLDIRSMIKRSIDYKIYVSKPDFKAEIGNIPSIILNRYNGFYPNPCFKGFLDHPDRRYKNKDKQEYIYFDMQALKDTLIRNGFSSNVDLFDFRLFSPNSWQLGYGLSTHSPQSTIHYYQMVEGVRRVYLLDRSYQLHLAVVDTDTHTMEYVTFMPTVNKCLVKSKVPKEYTGMDFVLVSPKSAPSSWGWRIVGKLKEGSFTQMRPFILRNLPFFPPDPLEPD